MSGLGKMALALGALWVLGSRNNSSPSHGTPGAPGGVGASGGAGASPPTPPPGGWPQATRTGPQGPTPWRQFVAEVYAIARAALAREGCDDLEQMAGAFAIAVLAQSETSGSNEYAYNVGNLRPVGSQPRARWPNGILFRSFTSRSDGVSALVRVVRTGQRYRDAWVEMVALIREGEPVEPVVAAWYAAIHERGYTDPPSTPEARQRATETRLRQGLSIADLVARVTTDSVHADTPPIAPTAAQTASVAAPLARLRALPAATGAQGGEP